MHVLPPGFQKICYYGFLNNRMKRKNLKLIFTLQGHQRFKRRFVEIQHMIFKGRCWFHLSEEWINLSNT
ncbi:MAG: hypothetical protein ACLU7M_01955 [Mediterraneibacter gnavus]